MRHYCTLFDSNYLARAIVMLQSLERTGEEAKVYVVCFDDLAFEILRRLKLPQVVAIRLAEFESENLLAVKGTRTPGEYCWTCTPHVIRYVLEVFNLPEVTYLDADLCFYGKPSVLLDELEAAGGSVLLTPHRYTPRYDYSSTSGIYCVQFMTFKADRSGILALQWWQDRCLEWCYARAEEGKFGDQKYLDDWTTRFERVHELQHLGGGVAPWNVQQYRISGTPHQPLVDDQSVIFYHFQNYKYYRDGIHDFVGMCRLSADAIRLFYLPYAKAILEAHSTIAVVAPEFNRGWSVRDRSWRAKFRYLKRILHGVHNEYRVV
jgi:hypothetical protein